MELLTPKLTNLSKAWFVKLKIVLNTRPSLVAFLMESLMTLLIILTVSGKTKTLKILLQLRSERLVSSKVRMNFLKSVRWSPALRMSWEKLLIKQLLVLKANGLETGSAHSLTLLLNHATNTIPLLNLAFNLFSVKIGSCGAIYR